MTQRRGRRTRSAPSPARRNSSRPATSGRDRRSTARARPSRRRPARGTTSTPRTVAPPSAIARSAVVLHRDARAAAEEGVGGDQHLRRGVLEPRRDRLGAVAGEAGHRDRADLERRQQRGDGLGNHRQEERDPVAVRDSQRHELRRAAVDLGGEIGERQGALAAVVALPDDRDLAGARRQPAIETEMCRVDAPVDEPARPCGATARVEHAAERREPLEAELVEQRRPERFRVRDREAVQLGVARGRRRQAARSEEASEAARACPLGIGREDPLAHRASLASVGDRRAALRRSPGVGIRAALRTIAWADAAPRAPPTPGTPWATGRHGA